MFINYTEDGSLLDVERQHNIMVFIGNGFDISVLRKYRQDKVVSSYSKFYDYLCYKGFNASNVLFKKMTEDKQNNKENWSDFEYSMGELIEERTSPQILNNALKEIQNMFLLFLNEIVTPDVLLKISEDAEDNEWGTYALSDFLCDLGKEDYEKMSFPKATDHYHMYNYLFVNFNYTSLFDNYIFLDKHQFKPRRYKTVDRNFQFYPNPNAYELEGTNDATVWSSYIMTNTIHPHGYQNIPRSLLFGIENEKYASDQELITFNKSYWAQNNQKYRKYFEDAELFIIYGASIGETDSWWWKNIYNSVLTKGSELIIYYYNNNDYNSEYVKRLFIDSCKIDAEEEDILSVKERIYVVLYDDDSDNVMFGLNTKENPLK